MNLINVMLVVVQVVTSGTSGNKCNKFSKFNKCNNCNKWWYKWVKGYTWDDYDKGGYILHQGMPGMMKMVMICTSVHCTCTVRRVEGGGEGTPGSWSNQFFFRTQHTAGQRGRPSGQRGQKGELEIAIHEEERMKKENTQSPPAH